MPSCTLGSVPVKTVNGTIRIVKAPERDIGLGL